MACSVYIKLLIKNGAYVNIELDDKEWAPGPGLLHDAVERARPDLVEILLEAKDISAARKGEIVFYPPDGFTWDATPEKLLELYISNTGRRETLFRGLVLFSVRSK